MRYSSQREYLQIAQAVAVSVFALIGYVAVVQPKLVTTPTGDVAVTVPTGVLVLFGLLMLVFTGASATSPISSTSAAARLPQCATRARC